MKKHFTILIASIFFFASAKQIYSQSQDNSNNKFGIHIIDESDLDLAEELVNSNGGEWGYVTVVIREDERDSVRWQRIFDKMRRLKLIPIVRIATTQENGIWKKPSEHEANNWSAFLDNLIWPVKDRYVVLYNEPNHAKEWGGKISPEEYADIFLEYKNAFKKHSDEFVVLPAALDLAAPNSANTMDSEDFWERMHEQNNFVFTEFDALNSHSYPNPGFSASPDEDGKKSIRGYRWEIDLLKNYGLDPDIDVFITETGWVSVSDEDDVKVSKYYKTAFENAWSDTQIKAITPFLLNYIGEPFDKFALINNGEKKPQFEAIYSLKKIKGEPIQKHSYKLESTTIADSLVSNSNYLFYLNLKNTGQSIWNSEDGFGIHFQSTLNSDQISIGEITPTEPNQTVSIPININTTSRGKHTLTLQLNKDGQQIGNLIEAKFNIIAPPALEIRVKGWFGKKETASDFTVILSEKERQIMKIEDVLAVDGLISLPYIYNIIPGREHQLTIMKNYHIAKTKNIIIDPNINKVNFGRLVPLDLNNDNKFDIYDLIQHIANPVSTSLLISPF